MQKIVLFMILMVSLYASDASKDKSVCNAPFDEYQYYKTLSNDTNTSDMKERYLEISDKFYIHYKKCVRKYKENIYTIKYKTFKDD